MVDLSRGLGSRIIRFAPLLPLLVGCSLGGGSSSHTASSATVIVTSAPSAVPTGPTSAWVLSPVGLNLRAQPSASSTRLGTLARGVQLDVLGTQGAGGASWLHVRGHDGSGTDGWVLDDPELVIHRAVNLHFDSTAGWSLLFPAEWTLKTGTPTEFSGPGQVLQVWTSPQTQGLPDSPGAPGKEVRDEGPVVVYSTTTFITVYQLDAGGFEYDDRVKVADNRYFHFRFRDSGPTPGTALFKQLLASVLFV